MRINGKKLKGIGCASVAAVSMLALSGCTNYSKMMEEQPQEYISLASENTAKSMMKSSFKDEYAILEEALKEGTFNVELDVEGITVGGEFYVNAKDYLSSQLYSIGAGGKEIELYVASDKDSMKLGTLSESGNHIYELNFNTLAEDFAESVFAPDSGSEFALAQSDYDALVEAYGQIVDMLNGEEEASESFAELEAVINEFMEDNEPEVEEKVKVEIGKDEVKANVITYEFDKNDITSLLDDYMDAVIDTVAEAIPEEEYDPAELKDEAMAEINTALESVEKMDMEIVYYVNSKTNSLMQVEINVDASVEGETAEVELIATLGAEPEKAEEQTLEVNIKAGGQKVGALLTAENDENSTEITVEVTASSVTMELLTITCERDDEDYTIELDIPMASVSGKVEGTIKTEKKSCEITVDELSFSDGSEDLTYSPNFKIGFAKGGEYNDLEAEKNLLKLTEEDIEQLAADLETDFMALAENISADSALAGSMTGYVSESRIAEADANAKLINVSMNTALVDLYVQDFELTSDEWAYELYLFYDINNMVADDTNLNADAVAELANYLDGMGGYAYVSIDPDSYTVNYALWSEAPIGEYDAYQLSEYDREYLAEEGTIVGCYPLYEYEW